MKRKRKKFSEYGLSDDDDDSPEYVETGSRSRSSSATSRITRNMDAPEREKDKQKKIEEEKEAQEQAQRDYEEEIKNRPKALPGNRNDGQFHIAFVEVGMGDCTILTTPGGQTILIDCGTNGQSKDNNNKHVETREVFTKRIQDTIYGPKFLGTNKTIDIMVLTHNDQDHWNLLDSVLGSDTRINKCYHSGDLGKGYGNTRTVLIDHGCKLFRAITHNEMDAYIYINGEKATGETAQQKIDVVTLERCDIRIVDEDNCKISILSSNVYPDAGKGRGKHYFFEEKLTFNSSAPNRGSLVLLVEVFDKKILICGDATLATEEFLMLHYAPWLLNIDLVRVAHHGSDTSSNLGFIKLIAPKKCVISSGRNIKKFGLPKLNIVERYLQVLPQPVAIAPAHFIFGWEGEANNTFTIVQTSQEMYITGMNGTQEITYPSPTVTTTPIVTSKVKK